MNKSVLGAALAAMVCGSSNELARADTINVIGYANDIVYDDAHYTPDGPVSATFLVNDLGAYLGLGGADVYFSIAGKKYDFAIPDDGYGRAMIDSNGLQADVTYLTGIFDAFAFVNFSSKSTPTFQGTSYTLRPGDIGEFSALSTFTDPDTNVTTYGLEVSFRPVAVSLNGVATVGVGAVPLPASAPMFGAALMALGVVGYGLKRTEKAAA